MDERNNKTVHIYRNDLTLPPLTYYNCSGFACEDNFYHVYRYEMDELVSAGKIHISEVMFIIEIPVPDKPTVTQYASAMTFTTSDVPTIEVMTGC